MLEVVFNFGLSLFVLAAAIGLPAFRYIAEGTHPDNTDYAWVVVGVLLLSSRALEATGYLSTAAAENVGWAAVAIALATLVVQMSRYYRRN